MSKIVDDDPPIKTWPASKEYRDNYDRIFNDPEEPRAGQGPNVVVNGWVGETIDEKFAEHRARLRDPRCTSNECEIRNTCTGSARCPKDL